MMPCLFDTKQHEILSGGDILLWVKKEAPAKEKDRFFLYRHRIANTFVIARWASDRALGIFTDFQNLGYSLSNFTMEKANEFRRRLHAPLSASKMARVINQTSRDYDRGRMDEDGEERERLEKRRRDN